MPLSIQSPTQEQIAAHPREYAIYREAFHQNNQLDVQELHALAKKYGNPKGQALSGDGEVSWDQLVQALKAPPSAEWEGAKTVSEYRDGSTALGMATFDSKGKMVPTKFTRRQAGPDDVTIQITNCGICHSDLHQVFDEWGNTRFPLVPGHEIVGIVTAVGPNVTKYKVGDRAGVGCMVESCRKCQSCGAQAEQFCSGPCTFTYNSPDPDGSGAVTKGGYSTHAVVNQDFVLRIPDNLSMAGAAPLLCAGITVYSPLRHYGLDKPGMKLGVVGLGGLGHMAVKISKAMGMDVTVLSTSANKKDEATKNLGADHFVVSKSAEEMKAAAGTLDGIIDTVSADHPLPDYLNLLKLDGTIVMVGVPPTPLQLPTSSLIFGRKRVAGSLIGGIAETQEMLDFCGKHNITSEIEEISASYLDEAYKRMLKSDVRYRFVIDVLGSMIK